MSNTGALIPFFVFHSEPSEHCPPSRWSQLLEQSFQFSKFLTLNLALRLPALYRYKQLMKPTKLKPILNTALSQRTTVVLTLRSLSSWRVQPRDNTAWLMTMPVRQQFQRPTEPQQWTYIFVSSQKMYQWSSSIHKTWQKALNNTKDVDFLKMACCSMLKWFSVCNVSYKKLIRNLFVC